MPQELVNDDALVDGCLREERNAQRLLYERYSQALLMVCLRYARDQDDAQDILQNAFLKIFTKLDTFSREKSLYAWMQSVVVRTSIDHYRSRRREQKYIIADDDNDDAHHAYIEENLAADELLALIQNLPDTHRGVFNLFIFENRSHKEIADLLGLTEGSSKWYLCDARKTLRKQIAVNQLIAQSIGE